MTDIATLAFGIDTSDVRRGVNDLDSMSQSSDRLARSHDNLRSASIRFAAEAANLIERTSQMRQQFEQTSASLDGMLDRLDSARQKMNQSAADFSSFASARAQVEALGAAYGQTSTQLELYNQKAVQIGLSSQQTVMSLQRITDAMTAQTAAGQAIRQTMQDYGVSLSAITGGNAASALQAFVDKIKTVQDSATKFRQVQAVLGPLDSGTYAGLNDPDYVPLQTLRQRAITRQINEQVANTTRGVAIGQGQLNRDDAAFADLSQQFNVNRVSQADRQRIAQQLGPMSNFSIAGTSTQAGRLSLLQYLASHPDDAASGGAMSPAAIRQQLGAPFNNWLASFGNGVFEANQGEIQYRYDQESQNAKLSSFGFPSLLSNIAPFVRSQYRELQNVFGQYGAPKFDESSRPLSYEERQQRDSTASRNISRFGYGDGGLSESVATNELLHQLTTEGVNDQFRSALGGQEGDRLYDNIRGQLQYRQNTAKIPGQEALDSTALQNWLLSVPRAQRGVAKSLVDWTGKYAPDVQKSQWSTQGLDLGWLLNPTSAGPGALGEANVNSFSRNYLNQTTNRQTSANEDFSQQIERQRQLTDATREGAAAVEALTKQWEAYDDALQKGINTDQAKKNALDLLSEQQRAAATKIVTGLQQQNENQYRINALVGAAGSDPAAKVAASAQAGIENDYAAALRDYPELQRQRGAYIGSRATALGQGAVSSASDMTAASEHELSNQRALLGVANQRADVQAKMARDQAVNDQYAKQLGDAEAADRLGGTHTADAIQAQIDKAKELKDALSAVNAEASLFKLGNDVGQQAENEAAILGLPRAQQGAARARLPVLQTFQSGGLAGGGIGNYGGAGGSGVIPPSDRLAMAQSAVVGTPVPPELLVALVNQESSWNPGAANGGLGQILPGTATSPGYGLQGTSPGSLQDPANNLAFTAEYLAARGAKLGMTNLDWKDPKKVAQVLQAYNGGGDPDYVQHVERYLPGGYFSGPGATVPYGAALNSAVADPAGRYALNAADRGYQLQIAGQIQGLQAGASQQQAASAAALPFLATGQTGAAAYARAGAIGNNPDTLDATRAALAQQGVQRAQQEDFTGQIANLQQTIDNNNAMTTAIQNGTAAVDLQTASVKANALAMRDASNSTQQQTAYQIALAKEIQAATAAADQQAAQQHQADQSSIDRGQYQLSLGVQSERSIQTQMSQYDAQRYVDQHPSMSPDAQQKYLNDQAKKTQVNQQLQDQQAYQSAFDQAGNAISSTFAGAITNGQGLHNVFQTLIADLAQIAIKAVITQPITQGLNSVGGSLFGHDGFFGNLFGSTTAPGFDSVVGTSASAASSLQGFAALSAGGVFSKGRLMPFAQGGVLNSPTTWMMASGDVALAGEAGSEAIMPLKRLPNGDLGIQSGGGGGGTQIHVNTPVTINGSQSGSGGTLDSKTIAALQRQIEMSAQTAVKGVIANERRPGGDLYF